MSVLGHLSSQGRGLSLQHVWEGMFLALPVSLLWGCLRSAALWDGVVFSPGGSGIPLSPEDPASGAISSLGAGCLLVLEGFRWP